MLMDGIQFADLLLITPSCPARFRNIPHMSFDDTAKEPEQTFSLSRDPLGELEYPTKYETDPGVWGLLLPATAALSNLPDLGKISTGQCLKVLPSGGFASPALSCPLKTPSQSLGPAVLAPQEFLRCRIILLSCPQLMADPRV